MLYRITVALGSVECLRQEGRARVREIEEEDEGNCRWRLPAFSCVHLPDGIASSPCALVVHGRAPRRPLLEQAVGRQLLGEMPTQKKRMRRRKKARCKIGCHFKPPREKLYLPGCVGSETESCMPTTPSVRKSKLGTSFFERREYKLENVTLDVVRHCLGNNFENYFYLQAVGTRGGIILA